jgi:hypothetical protein
MMAAANVEATIRSDRSAGAAANVEAARKERTLKHIEVRTFVSSTGEEGDVEVSRVAAGLYRIEEFFGFCVAMPGFVPDDAGMGWLVIAEELEDRRLRVKAVVRDRRIQARNGIVLPLGFTASDHFVRFGETITALGGNWELFAHGLFSCYAPRDRVRAHDFDLSAALDEALRAWASMAQERVVPPAPR